MSSGCMTLLLPQEWEPHICKTVSRYAFSPVVSSSYNMAAVNYEWAAFGLGWDRALNVCMCAPQHRFNAAVPDTWMVGF